MSDTYLYMSVFNRNFSLLEISLKWNATILVEIQFGVHFLIKNEREDERDERDEKQVKSFASRWEGIVKASKCQAEDMR